MDLSQETSSCSVQNPVKPLIYISWDLIAHQLHTPEMRCRQTSAQYTEPLKIKVVKCYYQTQLSLHDRHIGYTNTAAHCWCNREMRWSDGSNKRDKQREHANIHNTANRRMHNSLHRSTYSICETHLSNGLYYPPRYPEMNNAKLPAVIMYNISLLSKHND